MESDIRRYMRLHANEFDNATNLAEECSKHLNHDEWLDDPDHIIWDLAIEYMEKYEHLESSSEDENDFEE